MCEINLESMQELLEVNKKVEKPKPIYPNYGIKKIKNLISETRNFIGTLDICQLSNEAKIEIYNNNDQLPEQNYLIIIKTIHQTESLRLLELLKGLEPLGIGIIYVDDLENEEILIIG